MKDKSAKPTTSKINSRDKGARGEREFIQVIKEKLNINLTRNLDQWRDGGFDILGVDAFAIEVKRYKTIHYASVRQWWDQAVEQAVKAHRVPVLVFRADSQPWRVRLPISFIRPDLPSLDFKYTIEVHMDLFCVFLREAYYEQEQIEESLSDW